MHNAAAGGHQSIIQLLIKHGADPNIENNVRHFVTISRTYNYYC